MNNKSITILADRIERDFLPFVNRPGRYIGGEINQVKKDISRCGLTVALCFPDIYEIAMSCTGLAVIYNVINKADDMAAERVFAPWIDAEKILRDKRIPLFSLESKAAVKGFDVIAFSLNSELCYTNVLNMLDLAGLEVRSSDRKETDPIVIAGGSMANCCEPLADFIDMFVIGEGEDSVLELAALFKDERKTGTSKSQILKKAARKFRWLYTPALYDFQYQNNEIVSFQPCSPELSCSFDNAVVENFETAAVPTSPVVPYVQAVHERVSIEIMRGCPGRCLFCQAGFCRRPVRFRSVEKITETAKASYKTTGFDTVSLLSLSTADYPHLEQLTLELQGYFQQKNVGLSLPSLRVDKQLKLLPKLVTSVRKGGLTIAVEAASEKLRKIINKPLKNEDLFTAVEAAYKAGWQTIKLYFMVGLPGETDEDVKDIVQLSFKLAGLRKKIDGKTGHINAAVSWFVPKAHTPFGWLGQKSGDYFRNAKKLILNEKKELRAGFLHFKFHNIDRSVLESTIGRGDRRLGKVIEDAWQNGAKFELWDECFDYEIWQEVFANSQIDLENLAQKAFCPDEILPWEHLGGPEKEYLLKYLEKSAKIQS